MTSFSFVSFSNRLRHQSNDTTSTVEAQEAQYGRGKQEPILYDGASHALMSPEDAFFDTRPLLTY